jgi:hypothetical protein
VILIPHAAAAGRRLAEREVPLTAALDVLRTTYRTVGDDPSFEAIRNAAHEDLVRTPPDPVGLVGQLRERPRRDLTP